MTMPPIDNYTQLALLAILVLWNILAAYGTYLSISIWRADKVYGWAKIALYFICFFGWPFILASNVMDIAFNVKERQE